MTEISPNLLPSKIPTGGHDRGKVNHRLCSLKIEIPITTFNGSHRQFGSHLFYYLKVLNLVRELKNKPVEVAQKFVDEQGVIEVALNYNEILDLIQILASCVDEMSVRKNVAVLHYLPVENKIQSALLKGVNITRVATLIHVECCPCPNNVHAIDAIHELNRVARYYKLMRE